MAANEIDPGDRTGHPLTLLAAAILAAGAAWWFMPLFHVVPLHADPSGTGKLESSARFNPADFAEKFWRDQLAPAAHRAAAASAVLTALQRDPAAAAQRYAHRVGLGGAAYYFVQGTGRVVAVGKTEIIVALDGAEGAAVALHTGPIFGNAVRDGPGLLDVNEFPGLAEFNALSAGLNRLVETRVVPALRERAVVGATLAFAGCAEAPEGAVSSLTLVPVAVGGTP